MDYLQLIIENNRSIAFVVLKDLNLLFALNETPVI